ncbi:MAG TPA: hypothetical protein VN950_15295 [Terriglobales bacterium]|nr:hypothetical protein [Terriglobales bacterium]
MESTQQSDRETCHAIVLSGDGGGLLMAASENGLLLPSVEIPRWRRHAECLTAGMMSEWGCEVICLFAPDVVGTGHGNGHQYQVVECWRQEETHPCRTVWRALSSLVPTSFRDEKDYLVVRQSLKQCSVLRFGTEPGPFAKPGWFGDLRSWVGETIGPLGYQLKGSFRQLNADPSFSLIRFDTDGPAVWFKAVGEPNQHEFPITLTLSHLFPGQVAAVLATKPNWNGWLSPEVVGTNLGETQNIEHWKSAAAALARLQIDSIGRQGDILGAGARDLGLLVLLDGVAPFFDGMRPLMEQQSKVLPPPLSGCELQHLEEQIRRALVFVQRLEIPDTLGHLDLNPWNIIDGLTQCTFLDWAEACVAHPFFSIEYLLEHFRRAIGTLPPIEAELVAAYVREWDDVQPHASVASALTRAPLLAAFAYAFGSNFWNDQCRYRTASTAGYLRALTRRMSREANRLTDRISQ